MLIQIEWLPESLLRNAFRLSELIQMYFRHEQMSYVETATHTLTPSITLPGHVIINAHLLLLKSSYLRFLPLAQLLNILNIQKSSAPIISGEAHIRSLHNRY